MANYTASALSVAQTKYSQQFNKPELRRKQNPALMLALRNQNALVDNVKELKKKDTAPVKAYLKKQRAAAAAVAKSHNHAGTKADSAEVTLAFIQIVEPFTILLKQGQNNIFSYAEMLSHELTESAKNIHSRAGTLALAYLQANRFQMAAVAEGTGGLVTYNNVKKAFEVAAGDKDIFFQRVGGLMRRRNYRGELDVIADQIAFARWQYLTQQGQGNQTNLGWQASGMEVAETTEDIDTAGYAGGGVALAMQKGSFAGLEWNDPVNRKGKGDYDSYNGGYGTVLDPLGSGMMFDFHAYTQRVDGSGNGGGVQDEQLEAELTLTISWVLSPLTTANDSVVHEFAQA